MRIPVVPVRVKLALRLDGAALRTSILSVQEDSCGSVSLIGVVEEGEALPNDGTHFVALTVSVLTPTGEELSSQELPEFLGVIDRVRAGRMFCMRLNGARVDESGKPALATTVSP